MVGLIVKVEFVSLVVLRLIGHEVVTLLKEYVAAVALKTTAEVNSNQLLRAMPDVLVLMIQLLLQNVFAFDLHKMVFRHVAQPEKTIETVERQIQSLQIELLVS